MVNAIQGSNLKQALSVALPQLAPWQPAAVALMAPDRAPLSFAGLADLVDQLCGDLARRGVRRGTAVGIVLPNGPEMAGFSAQPLSALPPIDPSKPPHASVSPLE